MYVQYGTGQLLRPDSRALTLPLWLASRLFAPSVAGPMPPKRPDAARGGVTLREKLNWLIHMQYVRQDYDACLATIEDHLKVQISSSHNASAARRMPPTCAITMSRTTRRLLRKDCRGLSEYPIYVKALIKRQRGEIAESLQLFQAATCLNPHNVANLKQVGRSLYLLGRHKAALDVYEEALKLGSEVPPPCPHNATLAAAAAAAIRHLVFCLVFCPPSATRHRRAAAFLPSPCHCHLHSLLTLLGAGLGNLAQQGPLLHVPQAVRQRRRVPEAGQLDPAARFHVRRP